MLKLVWLFIFASVLLEQGQSFPVDVVPAEGTSELLIPVEVVNDPVVPVDSEVKNVEPKDVKEVPEAPTDTKIAKDEEPEKAAVEVAPADSLLTPEKPDKAQATKEDAITGDNAPVKATPVQVEPEVKFLVPDTPKALEESEYGNSKLVRIWSNRLFQYHKSGGILRDAADRPQPATILTASEILMVNLVPQDAPHPLYSEEFTTLTDNFILDSLSSDYVSPDDEKLATPEGLIIKTKTGKDVVFKKDPKTSVLTANGITIAKTHKIKGDKPIIIFELEEILFNYRKEVDDAFKTLSKKSSPFPGIIKPKLADVDSSVSVPASTKESGESPVVTAPESTKESLTSPVAAALPSTVESDESPVAVVPASPKESVASPVATKEEPTKETGESPISVVPAPLKESAESPVATVPVSTKETGEVPLAAVPEAAKEPVAPTSPAELPTANDSASVKKSDESPVVDAESSKVVAPEPPKESSKPLSKAV